MQHNLNKITMAYGLSAGDDIFVNTQFGSHKINVLRSKKMSAENEWKIKCDNWHAVFLTPSTEIQTRQRTIFDASNIRLWLVNANIFFNNKTWRICALRILYFDKDSQIVAKVWPEKAWKTIAYKTEENGYEHLNNSIA